MNETIYRFFFDIPNGVENIKFSGFFIFDNDTSKSEIYVNWDAQTIIRVTLKLHPGEKHNPKLAIKYAMRELLRTAAKGYSLDGHMNDLGRFVYSLIRSSLFVCDPAYKDCFRMVEFI